MIERLKSTQTTDEPQTPQIPMGKEGTRKYQKEQAAKEAEPSTIGKIWSMAELMAMKREDLEKVANEKGIVKPHLCKNKEDIITMIAEVDDVILPDGLTQKQEKFCQLYATDREFFGNGTQAYMEAFKVTNYVSAQAAASRLLSNVMVLDRISELLQEHSLNDANVEKQMGFWLTQKAHPQAAVATMKLYLEMRGKIGKVGDVTNNYLLMQQNNSIHFNDPRARKVIEGFDDWLKDNTLAPQSQEGEQDATQERGSPRTQTTQV